MGVAVGSVAIPGSTGNFSVSGLPWQPVAVMFFSQFDHLSPWSVTFGCATASGEQWGIWAGTASEISGYTQRKREGRTDACAFHRHAGSDAEQWRVSLVSLNSAGFTMNLDVINSVGSGEGANLYYMAMGGDHITDAYAGTVTAGGSTGTIAVTDPGFLPTAIVFAQIALAADTGVTGFASFGTGVTDGITQYASYAHTSPGTALDVRHIHRTDAVSCYWSGTNRIVIELASLDSGGFTLDVTEALADSTQFYLAINAEGAVAGHDVQPDSDGAVSYSTPGLKPEGVFFCWPGVDTPSTSGSSTPPLRPGVGAGTVAAQRMSAGISRDDAPFGVYTSDGYQIAGESMGFWGKGSGVGGDDNLSQASSDVTAVADGSFELTWSEVQDTNDRAFGWLALPGELSFRPQFYRVQPGGRIS